ncbi:MAG TPA: phosphatase PAP2 family protein [Microthrixaceae bacterium]|nr:phosphatase PAP2 family protein [Microthrixaceae bacterium]HNI35082.1 phosphatase PAP2 family protein [Microthrixaceae bacterium]
MTTAPGTTTTSPPPGPLAGLIDQPWIDAFDETVDGWAERLRGNPVADRLFYGLSAVGDHGIVWQAIALARVPIAHDRFVEAVELSCALGVEAAVLNGPIKMLFRRRRPVADGPRPLRLRQPRTSSFPSGHASAGIFAAVLVSQRSRNGWMWYTLGGLVGWSRVHVKIHHPSDVVGGYAAGWLLARIALRVLPRLRRYYRAS